MFISVNDYTISFENSQVFCVYFLYLCRTTRFPRGRHQTPSDSTVTRMRIFCAIGTYLSGEPRVTYSISSSPTSIGYSDQTASPSRGSVTRVSSKALTRVYVLEKYSYAMYSHSSEIPGIVPKSRTSVISPSETLNAATAKFSPARLQTLRSLK